jgi:hypothetical protein
LLGRFLQINGNFAECFTLPSRKSRIAQALTRTQNKLAKQLDTRVARVCNYLIYPLMVSALSGSGSGVDGSRRALVAWFNFAGADELGF